MYLSGVAIYKSTHSDYQIHVEKDSAPETTTEARKLMHRIKEDEVMKLMDEVDSGRDQ